MGTWKVKKKKESELEWAVRYLYRLVKDDPDVTSMAGWFEAKRRIEKALRHAKEQEQERQYKILVRTMTVYKKKKHVGLFNDIDWDICADPMGDFWEW